MDTLAAIALSTEPPMEKILKQPPTSNASILTAPIWRQIIGISLWNTAIIVCLYFFGRAMGNLFEYEWYMTKLTESEPAITGESTNFCRDILTAGNWTSY